VANSYAQDYAAVQHDHGSPYANRQPSEREWEAFGQDLLREDLRRRQYWLEQGNPRKALNLPGEDVQVAHDRAFDLHDLDSNCWTPRLLLEAVRQKHGEDAAEQTWQDMLDNDYGGALRIGKTVGRAFDVMPTDDAARYVGKLALLEGAAATQHSAINPDLIGTTALYHYRNVTSGEWYMSGSAMGVWPMRVSDPARIAELEDIREVRLERQEKATQFHADDPYRELAKSPRTAAVDPNEASAAPIMLANMPDHPDHSTYARIHGWVAGTGHWDDAASHNVASALYRAQAENGLVRRVDEVSGFLGEQGEEYVTATYAPYGDRSPQFHARIDGREAAQQPAEQNLRQVEEARLQQLSQTAQREREPIEPQQAGPTPTVTIVVRSPESQMEHPHGPIQ